MLYIGYKVSATLRSDDALSCLTCGYYPTAIIGDAMPSQNFDVRYKKIHKGSFAGNTHDLMGHILSPDVSLSVRDTAVEFPTRKIHLFLLKVIHNKNLSHHVLF